MVTEDDGETAEVIEDDDDATVSAEDDAMLLVAALDADMAPSAACNDAPKLLEAFCIIIRLSISANLADTLASAADGATLVLEVVVY